MPLITPESETYIEYNGFKFPQYHRLSTSANPVATHGNRGNKYIEVTITLETWITYDILSSVHSFGQANATGLGISVLDSGDKLDTATPPLFRKLLAKGKKLVVKGLGIGNYTIDNDATGNTIPDLNNGPTPSIVQLTNFTEARAYRLIWSVTFTVSTCETNPSTNKITVNGFDFVVYYGVNPEGMITRTVTGRISVFNWVKFGKTAINIDPLREKVETAFPLPSNFQRQRNYHYSENRTELHFTLTDTEIASNNAYPRYITSINVQQTASLNKLVGLSYNDLAANSSVTISGSLEVAPGVSKDYAWLAIISIINQKVRDLSNPLSFNEPAKGLLTLGFTITDGLYDRSVSFAFSYTKAIKLRDFWQDTRMFKPLAETWKDWDLGRAIYNNSLGFQGEIVFDPTRQKDYVVTACDQSNLPENDVDAPESIAPYTTKNTFFGTALRSEVSQAESYLSFRNSIRIGSQYNIATPGVIGSGDAAQTSLPPSGGNLFAATPIVQGQGVFLNNTNETEPDEVQIRGTGEHELTISGTALRVRYPAEIPGLKSVTGLPQPVLIREHLEPSHIAGYTADGIPIYRASWIRTYFLPGLSDQKIEVGNLTPIDTTPNNADFRES